MNKLLNIYHNIGIKHTSDDYLKDKIHTSLQAGLALILCLSLPLGLAAFQHELTLLLMPAFQLFAVAIMAFLFNQKAPLAGRIVLATVPAVLLSIYHGLAIPAANSPSSALLLQEMAIAFLPFLLFEKREKIWLALCSAVNFFAVADFILFKNLSAEFASADIYTDGFMAYLLNFSAVIFTLVLLTQALKKKAVLRDDQEKVQGEIRKVDQDLSRAYQKKQTHQNEIEANRQQEEKRKWAAQGYTLFSDILQKNQSITESSHLLLKELLNYMKANQGRLYLAEKEQEEKYLKLIACHAFNRKKYIEQRIEFGQGLLGRAFQDGEHIYLPEAPKNFINITSGLGDEPPTVVLIMPLINNNSVEGMLEIASYQALEDFEIDFVRKVGENFASAIYNNRVNERTKRLLAEAQQQAEELRTQEEEMRQNMEELSATQEDMHRKENDYLKEIQRLEEKLK
jgi:GAF domain-containing protein